VWRNVIVPALPEGVMIKMHTDRRINLELALRKAPSVFLSIPLLCLVILAINCPFVPSADAQTCGGEGIAVQVFGSGGPELQDKRASSSYLVWQDGQARVLVELVVAALFDS
jgi:hypothetical protein